jgi:hypothetical protein
MRRRNQRRHILFQRATWCFSSVSVFECIRCRYNFGLALTLVNIILLADLALAIAAMPPPVASSICAFILSIFACEYNCYGLQIK